MLDTHIEIEIDGESHSFAPTSLQDWSAFCRHINGLRSLGPNVPVSFGDMMDAVDSLEGMTWIVHRAYQRANPDRKVTRDDVTRMVPDIATLTRVASSVMAVPDEDEADPPRAEEARST